MKKNLFVFVIVCVFVSLLSVSFTSAFFTQSHTYWTVNGFTEVDSAITNLCKNDIDKVVDGNIAADVSVLHYFDDEFMSYVSTHTRGSGYQACLNQAGTDIELRCFCYGVGLHNVQDHFAHTEGGLVPKYIEKYFSSNLIGHMTIENDFEKKHLEYLKNTNYIKGGDAIYYEEIILNNFFEETGGNYKYLNILNEMSGLDMRNDINIFANGYKGQGFYDTVYNKKLSLPWWFWSLSFGLIILGLGGVAIFFIFGKTNWKWALILMYLVLAILGALVLISFYTGNTWAWVKVGVSIMPIRVSMDDVSFYDAQVQTATNRFLETGILPFDDNSGLTYIDRNGNQVEGALGKSEKLFQIVILPIITFIFVLINSFLIYKTFKTSKNRKKK